PVLIGLWSAEALGGFLAGALVVGFLMAVFMANAGGAWDNAKKYIEAGNLGGKGSDTHKAAVVGDTVGDPFKDTAGPSMNIMIKVMSVVAVIFAPLFM
ncbi:MAG: sodium/proton-translocating pyrophosphatase, partial [bacterium]